jgi:hypothetical protein
VCYRNRDDGHLYIQKLMVSNDDTIMTSAPIQCNTDDCYHITMAQLTPNKILLCYSNYNDNYYRNCQFHTQLLTIDEDDNIMISDPIKYDQYGIIYTKILKISNGRALMIYNKRNGNNSLYTYDLCAEILEIRDDVIIRSPIQYSNMNSLHIETILSSNKVLTFYKDHNDRYLYVQMFTITDDNVDLRLIKCGNYKCGDYKSTYTAATFIASNVVLVCYCNQSDNNIHVRCCNQSDNNIYAQIITISDDDIQKICAPVKMNYYKSHNISITPVSSDKVLMCYSNISEDYNLYAQIITEDMT